MLEWVIEQKAVQANNPRFTGHRNPDLHRTVGSHRAWCECGEWCYPRVEAACRCCLQALAAERPCPTCGGTGIAPVACGHVVGQVGTLRCGLPTGHAGRHVVLDPTPTTL
jgi:hypothetical protein